MGLAIYLHVLISDISYFLNLVKKLTYAPIVLFVFMRPEHTLRTLQSLSKNPEFNESPLFIYCDGPRDVSDVKGVEDTRIIVQDWDHPNKTILDRKKNIGLASSVIEGVTSLCDDFGRVIVVEDDLIVSPAFLNYMNIALNKYEKHERIMQISAHMFPVPIESESDAVILPFTTSWGWATWADSWKFFDPSSSGLQKLKCNKLLRKKFDLGGSYPAFRMLKRQEKGLVDSWAIRWYLSVFLNDGLVLFPKQSLVFNDGFDGSGTNCKNTLKLDNEIIRAVNINHYPKGDVDNKALLEVANYLKKDQAFWRKLRKYMGALWVKLKN